MTFRTFTAFGIFTQSVVCLLATLAAFSLHIGFTAALTGDQPSSDVRHPVTDSSIQRAHRIAVTGCRNKPFINRKHVTLKDTTVKEL